MNYPRNALSNYKQGRVPSAKRILELAQYFGVTPEYLLGGNYDIKSPSADYLFKLLDGEEREKMCLLCYEWLLIAK